MLSPSPSLLDANGNLLRVSLSERETLNLVRQTFPPAVVRATIAAEDARFYRHRGVDVRALIRAAIQNLRARKVVSGGSTLTMQYIKLMNPSARTIRHKLVEMVWSLKLERTRTKDSILAAYLNHVSYGGNLEGIEIASRVYFGHPADELSTAQAALLAGLPKAPGRLDPLRFPDRARRRRNYVLDRMAVCGFLTRAEADRQKDMPLDVKRHPLPFEAPHACDWILARAQGGARKTSIQADVHRIVDEKIRQAVETGRPFGIGQGAGVVLEIRTGRILAMIGSADYRDNDRAGQVNGATAPRSPGSTLKPFLYAMAFERGLISPSSAVADVPADYIGIEPENFNRKCQGVVRADAALLDSLNVPAVGLAEAVGLPDFLGVLRNLGLRTLTEAADYYGLGLILGTGDVTLLDLTNAYAALARGGVWQPYTSKADERMGGQTRIMSEEAAYLVSTILQNPSRFGRDAPFEFIRPSTPSFAWKTGTSNGHRDAWTVGYNSEYAVGIWFGNFDGRSSERLVGAEIAAPIVAGIFTDLYNRRKQPAFPVPEGVSWRSVCARSGDLPGPHCDQERTAAYITGVSPSRPCAVHREIWINPNTGRQAPIYQASPGFENKVVECWPPRIEQFLRTRGLALSLAPPDNADDPHPAIADKLLIRSPVNGRTYSSGEIVLQASSPSAETPLFWFIDGQMFSESPPDRPVVLRATSGRHHVICADARGRHHAVQFSVNY